MQPPPYRLVIVPHMSAADLRSPSWDRRSASAGALITVSEEFLSEAFAE
jgi:hypothetical protein